MLGLRRGELLGLRWQDTDLDARKMHIAVSQQTEAGKLTLGTSKTESSTRTLPLPSVLVPILRAHHVRQLEDKAKNRPQWQDHGLVFCTSVGTPIGPRNLVRDFKKLLARAELPNVRLRHTCASLLAAHGVPVRMAQEILGHANSATTQDIYTHVYQDSKQEVADLIDRLFGEDGPSSKTG